MYDICINLVSLNKHSSNVTPNDISEYASILSFDMNTIMAKKLPYEVTHKRVRNTQIMGR